MNKNLIKEAEALIREVDRTHRYSMSKIYGLYNRVFETNETPQSCASCLIRKVRELRSWLEKEKLEVEKGSTEVLLVKPAKKTRISRKRKEG